LTGAIDEATTFNANDFRNIIPRFSPAAGKANRALVLRLDEIATEKHAMKAQTVHSN
jgi:hypothetical protein